MEATTFTEMPPVRRSLERRKQDFWSKVRKTKGCWIWTGGTVNKGYGVFWINGHRFYVHRLAYEWLVGPIPDGMHIDHVRERGCKSRACVNPAHLEAVTMSENSKRTFRTHCQRGHPLTEENSYYRPDGDGRSCKECQRMRGREYDRTRRRR